MFYVSLYHMCVWGRVGAEVHIWCLPESLLTLFFKTSLLPNLELVDFIARKVSGPPCMLHSSEGIDVCYYAWLLCGWESRLRSLCLCRKYVTQLDHLPSPLNLLKLVKWIYTQNFTIPALVCVFLVSEAFLALTFQILMHNLLNII